jgi:hypothetical protein
MAATCGYEWNPGVWPLKAKCVLNANHKKETGSDHTDRRGNTFPAVLDTVSSTVKCESVGYSDEKCGGKHYTQVTEKIGDETLVVDALIEPCPHISSFKISNLDDVRINMNTWRQAYTKSRMFDEITTEYVCIDHLMVASDVCRIVGNFK